MSSDSKPKIALNFPTSRSGQIQATVWENENTKDEEKFTTHSCTFQRRYYDEDTKEWKTASGFRPSDLLLLAHAAEELYRQLTAEKQKA